jgi:Na+-driven multidrug efflux pump
VSFATSFLSMVALDLILIGPYGALGAAVAATVSPALGLAVAVRYYRADGWHLAGFVPRRQDFVDFVRAARAMLTRGRPAVVESLGD